MVDLTRLERVAERRAGSSPAWGTILKIDCYLDEYIATRKLVYWIGERPISVMSILASEFYREHTRRPESVLYKCPNILMI